MAPVRKGGGFASVSLLFCFFETGFHVLQVYHGAQKVAATELELLILPLLSPEF